ncbi:hypothetical protein RF11_07330 [Thelohanellus kitauei]|uniref:Peptidase A2 domain-containing protein n=1 Tax=Thelohanellus kitauei TaxID=669202 RepID=A0A0C2JEP9_THEKT|nr:hypothetical protein RF11_07330 [Thelohanellus kitauei]
MHTGTNAVSLIFPTFCVNQQMFYLLKLKLSSLRNISDDSTIYHYIIAAFDQTTASQLLDVLHSPPANDECKRLKEGLLKVFGLNRRQRAARFVDLTECSDRMPSALLFEMQFLAGGHTSCMLFEEILLRHLPSDIRLQLAHANFTDLGILGEYADEIWHACSQNSFIDAFKAVNAKVTMPPRLLKTDVTQNFSEGRQFLIDTGADINVIPSSRDDRLHPNQNASLTAANSTRVRAHRERSLKINFGRIFQWLFITADVDQSIIGADFLKSFNLIIGLKGKSLVDPRVSASISCCLSLPKDSGCIGFIVSDAKYSLLLNE